MNREAIESKLGSGMLACIDMMNGKQISEICPDISSLIAAYQYAPKNSELELEIRNRIKNTYGNSFNDLLNIYNTSPMGSKLTAESFNWLMESARNIEQSCKILEFCRTRGLFKQTYESISSTAKTFKDWSFIRTAVTRNQLGWDTEAIVETMAARAKTPEEWLEVLVFLPYMSPLYNKGLYAIQEAAKSP